MGPVTPRRANGTGHINRDGYVVVGVNGKQVMAHRVVMEKMIGRPLLPSETVHHRNGVRTDNRPQNLELWSSSQPPGQRIEDKVRWAAQILATYRPVIGQLERYGPIADVIQIR